VVCIDKDASKIVRLQRYEIPIYEPGLEDIVRENAGAGRLAFTTDLAAAVRDVDLAFIAVGTNAKVQRLVEGAKHDIQVASNPEFLKEGGAISNFMYPYRIVIGVRPRARARTTASRSGLSPAQSLQHQDRVDEPGESLHGESKGRRPARSRGRPRSEDPRPALGCRGLDCGHPDRRCVFLRRRRRLFGE
jgi:hypothetical protein